MANFESSSSNENTSFSPYDVFINYYDPNVEKTFASHVNRRLREHGLRVCFNRLELQRGDNITLEMEGAIREASVHIAVFSPRFAESSLCLNELMHRLESMKDPRSGSTIIPVFYGVKPSELRWTRGNKGVYAQALLNFDEKKTFDSNTIENWRKAFSDVAGKSGFELETFNGDEGKLVNQIVKRVLKKLENHLYYDVFISYRAPDVKKTLASHLYHRLLAHGLRVFLDNQELQKGDDIFSQIEGAIATASVHIAIFSPGYAESNWCLDELVLMLKYMMESGSSFIPVFDHVKPSELQGPKGRYARALRMLQGKKIYDYQTNEEKTRYDSTTIANWRQTLCDVTEGFELDSRNCDDGQLVHRVVQEVLSIYAEKYPRGSGSTKEKSTVGLLDYSEKYPTVSGSTKESRTVGLFERVERLHI